MMAVIFSANHEMNSIAEWESNDGTSTPLVTSPVYRGVYALSINFDPDLYVYTFGGLNAATSYWRIPIYIGVSSNPSIPVAAQLLQIRNASNVIIASVIIDFSTAGVPSFRLINSAGGGGQIGSTVISAAATWTILELKLVISATVGILEMRINGSVVATGSNLNTGTANANRLFLSTYIDTVDKNGLVATAYYDEILARDNAYPGGTTAGDLFAPGLVGHGTASFTNVSGTSLTPALPTGWVADDIHIMFAHHSANGAWNTPSGWDIVTDGTNTIDDNNTSAQRVTAYIRRAVGGDSAPTLTLTTNTVTTVRGAVIIGVRGCPPGGTALSVVDVVARNLNAAAATISFPTATTTQEHDLVLALGAYEDDPSARSLPTGWNALTGAVQGSTAGNDMSLNYFWRVFSTGATGTFSTTVSGGTFANSVNVGAIIALKGIAVPAGGRTSKNIRAWPLGMNLGMSVGMPAA
jgi:hypothetical protein